MGNSNSSSRAEAVAPSSCPAVPNSSTGSTCPVIEGGSPAPIYNVYNQQINSEGGAGMFPGKKLPACIIDVWLGKEQNDSAVSAVRIIQLQGLLGQQRYFQLFADKLAVYM